MSSTFIINPTITKVCDKCITEEKFDGIKYFTNRIVKTYKPLNEHSYSNDICIGVLGIREHPIEFANDMRKYVNYKPEKNVAVQFQSNLFNLCYELSEIMCTKIGTQSIDHEILDPNYNDFIPTRCMASYSLQRIENHLAKKESIFYDINATTDIKNKYSQKKHTDFCEYESLPVFSFNNDNEIIRYKFSQNFGATPTNHLLSPYYDIDIDTCSNYKEVIELVSDSIYYFFKICGEKSSKKVVTILFYCVSDIEQELEDDLKLVAEDIFEDTEHILDYKIISKVIDKEICKKDFSARIIFNSIKIDCVLFDTYMKYATKYS